MTTAIQSQKIPISPLASSHIATTSQVSASFITDTHLPISTHQSGSLSYFSRFTSIFFLVFLFFCQLAATTWTCRCLSYMLLKELCHKSVYEDVRVCSLSQKRHHQATSVRMERPVITRWLTAWTQAPRICRPILFLPHTATWVWTVCLCEHSCHR